MSCFSPDEIGRIAALAKLSISSTEQTAVLEGLEKIITLVNKMNEINTDHILPLTHPHAEKQLLREDRVTETNQRDTFQKLAPQTEAGLYVVPAVIDKDA